MTRLGGVEFFVFLPLPTHAIAVGGGRFFIGGADSHSWRLLLYCIVSVRACP